MVGLNLLTVLVKLNDTAAAFLSSGSASMSSVCDAMFV